MSLSLLTHPSLNAFKTSFCCATTCLNRYWDTNKSWPHLIQNGLVADVLLQATSCLLQEHSSPKHIISPTLPEAKTQKLFNFFFFLLTLTYLQLCKQNPIWFFKAQRGERLSLDKCNQVGAVIFLFTSAAANSNVRGAIKQKPAIFQRSLTYFTICLGQVRHELIQWQVSQWRVRQELLN